MRVYSLWEAMFNPKVLLLALNYLGIVTASLGMLIFIPQIIKSLGTFRQHDGRLADHDPLHLRRHRLVVWGRISDKMNERRWNLLVACVALDRRAGDRRPDDGHAGGRWSACRSPRSGFYGSKGPFFAMPPMFLSGTALAAGFAWINSIGNLGGFFGPWYVGVMKDATGSFAGGLYGLALLSLISAVVCAFFLHIPDPNRSVAPRVAPTTA